MGPSGDGTPIVESDQQRPLTTYARSKLAGEQGTVLLTGLAPGIYTVSATLSGYRGTPARIRVLDGELSRGAVVLLPIKEDR